MPAWHPATHLTIQVLTGLGVLVVLFASVIGNPMASIGYDGPFISWIAQVVSATGLGIGEPLIGGYDSVALGHLASTDAMPYASLIAAALLLMGCDPGWTHPVLLVLHGVLTPLALTWVLRTLRVPWGWCTMAAVLIATSPVFFMRQGHVNTTGFWLYAPSVVAVLVAARASWRQSLVLVGAGAVLAGCGPQNLFQTAYPMMGLAWLAAVVHGWRHGPTARWRILGAAVVWFLISLGCAIPWLLPKFVASLRPDQMCAAIPSDLWSWIGGATQVDIHIWLLPVTMAMVAMVISVAMTWTSPQRWALVAITGIAVWMYLASYGHGYLAWDAMAQVPPWSRSRTPSRCMMVTNLLAVGMLAYVVPQMPRIAMRYLMTGVVGLVLSMQVMSLYGHQHEPLLDAGHAGSWPVIPARPGAVITLPDDKRMVVHAIAEQTQYRHPTHYMDGQITNQMTSAICLANHDLEVIRQILVVQRQVLPWILVRSYGFDEDMPYIRSTHDMLLSSGYVLCWSDRYRGIYRRAEDPGVDGWTTDIMPIWTYERPAMVQP